MLLEKPLQVFPHSLSGKTVAHPAATHFSIEEQHFFCLIEELVLAPTVNMVSDTVGLVVAQLILFLYWDPI